MRKTRRTKSVVSLLHTENIDRWTGYHTKNAAVLGVCLELGMSANYKPYAIALSHIEESVSYKTTQCLELLIRYHADVDCDDGYPIRVAAYENRLDVVNVLIKAGADVNLCGFGKSAISNAIMYANHTVFTQLLLAGATLPDNAMSLARRTKVDSQLKVGVLSRHAKKQG